MSAGRAGPRSGLSAGKAWRLWRLLWRPRLTQTRLRLARFEQLDPAWFKAAGLRGALLDADGTLAAHHVRDFSPEVIAAVARLKAAGIKLGVYTNASDEAAFDAIQAPLLRGLPAKPSVAGFRAAAAALGLPPAQVAMIGDSYITDGGAVEAGLAFIYCRPLPGAEPRGHKLARALAAAVARAYAPLNDAAQRRTGA
ncbi:HAD family hydrolase [Myxococcota bacterium]|nr:HAD family hydrolase [Myxococcota bacterium]MBU1900293.1 HAD family hydrolase [Myxococcota bacterium]